MGYSAHFLTVFDNDMDKAIGIQMTICIPIALLRGALPAKNYCKGNHGIGIPH
jgi:hypothetical protein